MAAWEAEARIQNADQSTFGRITEQLANAVIDWGGRTIDFPLDADSRTDAELAGHSRLREAAARAKVDLPPYVLTVEPR